MRTLESKLESVREALRDKQKRRWSARRIAEACNVSHTFVDRVITQEFPELEGRVKEAKDGKDYVFGKRKRGEGQRIDFDTLRSANVARCQLSFHGLDNWTPGDWATALAGEVGEACNIIKKLRRMYRTPEEMESRHRTPGEKAEYLRLRGLLAKELADVQIYLDLLAARFDIDLAEATVEKFNEVSHRVDSPTKLRR